MIPTPTDYRRLESQDGWILFFYGKHDVLAYVWDVDRSDECCWWQERWA